MEMILSETTLLDEFEKFIETVDSADYEDFRNTFLAGANVYAEHLTKNSDAFNDERYIRLCADFDNFRKRTITEKERLRKTAAKSVVLSMLEVVDDFERVNDMSDGIRLIYTKLINNLKKHGVMKIDVLGAEYDCEIMEAVTTIDHETTNCVVDVVSDGFVIHDEIIRYPKVVVSK